MSKPNELGPCSVCFEDCARIEHEGGWCVYVTCANCGSYTAYCTYDNETEKEDAVRKAVLAWNMGKVIAESRGE